jgi:hypothetical protein
MVYVKDSDIETIRCKLSSLGMTRLYIADKNFNKVLFLGVYLDHQFLILIAKGENSWYSKVVFADELLEPYWRCEYIIYVPEGLYTFARDLDELANKIVDTINKLIKRKPKV